LLDQDGELLWLREIKESRVDFRGKLVKHDNGRIDLVAWINPPGAGNIKLYVYDAEESGKLTLNGEIAKSDWIDVEDACFLNPKTLLLAGYHYPSRKKQAGCVLQVSL
jgi:hypothetical protein